MVLFASFYFLGGCIFPFLRCDVRVQGDAVKYFVSGGFAITHKDSPVTVSVYLSVSAFAMQMQLCTPCNAMSV